jgi:hypothetical protein
MDTRYSPTRALFLACRALELSAMQSAIDAGADVGALETMQHQSPLAELVAAWCEAPVRPDPGPYLDLLARAGADMASCGEEGRSRHPVSFLYLDDHMPMLRALDRHAPIQQAPGVTSGHCAQFAAYKGSPRLLAALFEHGSDRDPRGHDGGTLLHFAALCEPRPGRDIFGVFDFLLSAGLDESVRNHFGDTAMDICKAKLLTDSVRAYEAARVAEVARHLSSQLPGAGKTEGRERRRL